MKLRSILKLLALTAFLSASAAGIVYFYSLNKYVQQQAERQAFIQVQTISRYLAIFLSQYTQPAVTLAGLDQMRFALLQKDPQSLQKANQMLDHFNATLATDVCYLMAGNGVTIASSNRFEADSFVGENFSFRPYFKNAISGKPYSYLAVGTTSGKRGLYNSHPVYGKEGKKILGVAVIKASMDFIEKKVGFADNNIILVIDSKGVIFISNRTEWLYQFAWPLTQEEIYHIGRDRQFGTGPWHWVGLTKEDDRTVIDQNERRYRLHQMDIENLSGWKVIELTPFSSADIIFSNVLFRITGPIFFILYLFIGITIFFLYRKAGNEIHQREAAQKALFESEKRYRNLYQNTPAMLHSIGADGRIISVSDYWKEVLGYKKEEVIGRPLLDFFTPESREYAETKVFPEFFEIGFCKDVPYQFVKRSGELVDVLLSAISERNESGETYRSLAVSIDITERKKAEKALRVAQAKLNRYARNLESKVRKRTRDITSLLTYTPAVVYMKDVKGRYRLVNTRYERLFGVSMKEVHRKTDHEVLPKAVADQFTSNDNRVLKKRCSFQVEESILLHNEQRTYLSVKFPIYDGRGAISGVGGIATDITDLKNVQDQLVRLSGGIMESQEKERAYLARELHDELGQVLSVLNMDAVWLQKRFSITDKQATQRAQGMCQLIDKTIQEVRNISLRLRPSVLDHLGLLPALEWYTADFQRRSGIECIFIHDQVPLIDGAVATAAYRIVQEALTNVVRHSHAKRVKVSIKASEGKASEGILKVSVEDYGSGFNSNDVHKFKGLGLAGMRERAALVGSKLVVISRPEKGTRIDLIVPMENRFNESAK